MCLCTSVHDSRRSRAVTPLATKVLATNVDVHSARFSRGSLTFQRDQLDRLENHLGFFVGILFFRCGMSSFTHAFDKGQQ